MHIIAKKYLEKRASAAGDAVRQLASMHPKAYDILGTPGMYGMYSNYTPQSQYINATAPISISDAMLGGLGGLGASYALTGMEGLADLKLPASLRSTALIGGAMLGGLYGLGKGTAQYIGGKYLVPEN